MQDMVRNLVAQLKAAHAEVDRLHADAARRRSRDAGARPRIYAVPPTEPNAPEAPASPTFMDIPEAPPPPPIDVPADELEAMQAVYSLLDDDERTQFSTIVANMPPEDAQQLRARFAGADPNDAAATVRAFLSSMRSAS